MTSKKALSERDICTQFIVPALKMAGWDIERQVREEVFFTDGRIYVKGTSAARGSRNGSISDDNLRYLDATTFNSISKYTISKNDVYMTIVGVTIGKCGLVPEKFHNMNLTENAAKISPYMIHKEYLYFTFESLTCQNQFIDKTKQVGVQKMALNRLQTTQFPPLPLPNNKPSLSELIASWPLLKNWNSRLQNAKSRRRC